MVVEEIENIVNNIDNIKNRDIRNIISRISNDARNVLREIINNADIATRNEIRRLEIENNTKIDSNTVETLYEVYRFFYLQQYIISQKSDEEVSSYFKEQTESLSNTIKEAEGSEEILDRLLPKAYALTMNSCSRSLGKTPYMVQVIGAIVLNDGYVSEMATGEGKTITSSMPAYLNALTGKSSHIITPNAYLAKRDFTEMQKVYSLLGLSSGYTSEEPRNDNSIGLKQEVYQSDIVYGSASAFAFDYLNDTLETDKDKIVLPFTNPNFAIIDEVDAVLFDDAAVPYNIAGTQKDEKLAISEQQRLYEEENIRLAILATKELELAIVSMDEKEYDDMMKTDPDAFYQLDKEATIILNEKTHEVSITTLGYAALFCYYKRNEIYPIIKDMNLDSQELYSLVLSGENQELSNMFDKFSSEELIDYYGYINNAAKAWYGMQIDRDYILKPSLARDKQEEYILSPVISGRSIKGRHYSEGMQQALEAKERYLHPSLNIKETKITNTLATIPASSFFARYSKVGGMTGTSVESSFKEIYKLYTKKIPRNKKKNFKDLGDTFTVSEEEKFERIFQEVLLSRNKKSPSFGQPLLITTTSIENSQKLSAYLERRFKEEGIPLGIEPNFLDHIPVLNANVSELAKESEIIKKAGKFGAITISTEMAGRGTDIKLGGEVPSYEDVLYKFIYEYIKAEEKRYGRTFTKEEKEKIIIQAKKSEQIRQRTTKKYEMLKKSHEIENALTLAAGGLKVIGCGHFKYERVDNQVKGRSSRQGDAGCSKFFVDENDLRELGVSERTIGKLKRKLKRTPNYFETKAGQKHLAKVIKSAQASKEAKQEGFIMFNQKFESSVVSYRSMLFEDRFNLKKDETYIEYIEKYIKEISKRIVLNSSVNGDSIYYSKRIKPKDIKYEDLIKYARQILGIDLSNSDIESCNTFDSLADLINNKALKNFNELVGVFGSDAIMPAIKKKVDTTLNRVWDRFLFNVETVRNQFTSGAIVNVGSNDDVKANIDLAFDYSLETEIVDLLSSIFNINYGKEGYYIDRLRNLEVTTSRFTASAVDLSDYQSSSAMVR